MDHLLEGADSLSDPLSIIFTQVGDRSNPPTSQPPITHSLPAPKLQILRLYASCGQRSFPRLAFFCATYLFCISHVQAANNQGMWRHFYLQDFGHLAERYRAIPASWRAPKWLIVRPMSLQEDILPESDSGATADDIGIHPTITSHLFSFFVLDIILGFVMDDSEEDSADVVPQEDKEQDSVEEGHAIVEDKENSPGSIDSVSTSDPAEIEMDSPGGEGGEAVKESGEGDTAEQPATGQPNASSLKRVKEKWENSSFNKFISKYKRRKKAKPIPVPSTSCKRGARYENSFVELEDEKDWKAKYRLALRKTVVCCC